MVYMSVRITVLSSRMKTIAPLRFRSSCLVKNLSSCEVELVKLGGMPARSYVFLCTVATS